MRNPTCFLVLLALYIGACTAEPVASLSANPEIPAILQTHLKLQKIENQQRAPAELVDHFIEQAEAQFPIFAQEADFQNLSILHFECFSIYLSPLDEPGDYLALLSSAGQNTRLLFVEWGLQNGIFYLQLLAPDGEGLRFFESTGFEGEENAIQDARMGSLYPCCYGSKEEPLSWLNRFKKDWNDWLGNDPKKLATWVKGMPVGGILAMYGYAGVYLD
ncbi:hypothetical protein [Haliscomenobacter hydrossis]|uniref:Uncharacterized protein n=1 Tax=Haliscomenobacter hydrossis (strain ATCC 27775 / DSM 1100 / LMG 10767 / O) TaxID=760192 RepID=F4KUL6_HALH1|nr:hypothetical protein [Haliscomenobacter hydrossis]AEE52452.1 hypothetical protein Halhy_4616 [Haliscomenobacter hydrossis DSM 1100]